VIGCKTGKEEEMREDEGNEMEREGGSVSEKMDHLGPLPFECGHE